MSNMSFRLRGPAVVLVFSLLAACGNPKTTEPAAKLTVAVAANLTDVFVAMAKTFREQTNIELVVSYGSTAQLAQQIENGAPFDFFAAADVEHVDDLVAKGKLQKESRTIYALGQLALWVPKGEDSDIHELKDLASNSVRFISIAQPKLAPYGAATVEALTKAGLWESIQAKTVYANSISQAKQAAASGNADAAFTAYSLVFREAGTVIKIDRRLYRPIEQALAITSSTRQLDAAQKLRAFLLGTEGQAILLENGYLIPSR